MEQIPKSIKLKILFLFLISNILIFLIASPGTDRDTSETINSHERADYVEVVVSGELFTSFGPSKEVSLRSKDGSIIIPFGILLGQSESMPDEYLEDSQDSSFQKFSIYLHKQYLTPDVLKKSFQIFPYGTKLVKVAPKYQKRSYEIFY